MWWWPAAAVAGGADPAPKVTLAPRSVRVDVLALDPAEPAWGPDWKRTGLEQWTVALQCEPIDARAERCRFPEGVWWTAVVQGETERHSTQLPATFALELVWAPNGRVKSWDVTGDRAAFWQAAANAATKATYYQAGVALKADSAEDIGRDLESALAKGIAAALEWELPKAPLVAGLRYEPSQAPWVTRRWVQGVLGPDVTADVKSVGDTVGVTFSGTVKEVGGATEGNVLTPSVVTTLRSSATLDAHLLVVSARHETKSESGNALKLIGHARQIVLVAPWAAGQALAPADPPATEIP